MTSGLIRKAALPLLAALTLSAGPAHAGNASFRHLMALLAARRGSAVTFVAHTSAPGLTRALLSSGILRYRAPDHLEQRTLKPVPSEIILDGEQMTVRRGGETHQLDLRAYPQVAVYVEALRDTLGGHGAALQRLFAIRWQGTLADWSLTLRPRNSGTHVRQIRLAGAAANIHRIEILASHGALTVLRLGPPPAPP